MAQEKTYINDTGQFLSAPGGLKFGPGDRVPEHIALLLGLIPVENGANNKPKRSSTKAN